MKKLILFIFLAAPLMARADTNLFRNGDFSNGISHWEGDCHTPEAATQDLSSTPPPSGVVVKLRHEIWTRVTQDFDGKIGQYVLTVTYTISPDLKFSTQRDNYTDIPSKLDIAGWAPFECNPGQWMIVLWDAGAMHYGLWRFSPKSDSGLQTATAQVQLDSDDSVKKTVYLIFPPGEGSINLRSISMVD